MKVFRKVLIGFLSLFMLFTASMAIACQSNEPSAPSGFTVTFMVQGSQYGNQQTVQKGRRVVEPQAPTFSEQGYVFTGWFTTENFEEGTMWNFTTGMVVSDLTLYAGYRIVNEYVTEVAKANEAVSSKLVWTQSALSNATDYAVIIANAKGETTTLTGTVSYDEENYQVLFTPSVIPQGGIYSVSVQDTTKSAEACVVQNVMFNGAGTEANPYLIASEIDFDAVNKQNVAQGTYFSLAKNIAITTNRDSQKSFEFNGIFNGNGRTITISGNSGAIYKVGTNGVVKHVGIAGAISTSLYDSIGALVDFNAGRVEKINTTANVESTAGMVGTSGIQKALDETLEDGSGNRGIAGGIVGTNLTTGSVYNCKITTSSASTGTIKARIGGGTIVGYNKGSIELCASEGCIGAWNSNETGKSTSNYSYIGGIAGINAGTITKSSLSGSGKILAQRIKEGQIVEGTTNANVGGIAGYNMSGATISECYFEGIRVHGDENVGGIAGLNAGGIENCYVGAAYSSSTGIYSYVGGRTNVGGLVGKEETGSAVENCYVTANVYAYGENAVAYAASKNATNVVYLTANLNSKSLDNKTENPAPATITAPMGTGNVAIEIVGGSSDGTTTNYLLAESYLSAINGDSKFFFETTIKLTFINDIPAEETIDVALYDEDGNKIEDVEVAETGASITGPIKKGYVFAGWATSQGGEIVFAKGSSISLYDLLDYEDSDGKVSLYAVMTVKVPNEGLIVAVYDRYIDKVAGASADIESLFNAWMEGKGYTYSVEFRHYAGDKLGVSDFGLAVNSDADIDVVIGAGTNITSVGKVEYIARENMDYDGLTDRYACLLTDTERAIDFYCFITGIENANATIEFSVDGNVTSGTVNSVLGDTISVPEVQLQQGYEVKGWATTENATEPQITGVKFGYSNVKELLNEGTVKLYPVIGEIQVDLVVYIYLSSTSSVYITDTEADAIESAFATLLPNKVVKFVRVSGVKAAGFVEEINNAGNVDVYIGGKSSSGISFDSEYTKVLVGAGHFENDSRYVGIIDGCANKDLAITLYNYLTAQKQN